MARGRKNASKKKKVEEPVEEEIPVEEEEQEEMNAGKKAAKRRKTVPAEATDMESLRQILEAEGGDFDEEDEEDDQQFDEEGDLGEGENDDDDELEDDAPKPRTTVEFAEQHIKQLEELKKTDPKFFEYLLKNDPSLLNFSVADVEKEEDENPDLDEDEEEKEKTEKKKSDDDEDLEAGLEPDEIGDLAAARAFRKAKIMVTTAMMEQLEIDCMKSMRAFRKLVMIFKCACHVGDDSGVTKPKPKNNAANANKSKIERLREMDEENSEENEVILPYRIPNSSVFNRVMTFCFTNMRAVIEAHLLGNKEGDNEPLDDERLNSLLRRSNKRWQAIAGATKAFLGNVVFFIDKLTQDDMRVSTLTLVERYAPFFSQFPQLSKTLLNVLLQIWSSANEQARLLAFSNILQLSKSCPLAFLDVCLRGTYLSYIRAFGNIVPSMLPLHRFMRNCIVELFGVNTATSYRVTFAYIRQLAVHLRSVVLHTARNGTKAIQNWQFVNALRIWTDVLCAHAPSNDSMLQLVYPLSQVITGALDICQGARHVPIRFHFIRMMNDLSDSCGVIVNPTVPLLQCLDISELHKNLRPAKNLKPLDFSCFLHVSKQYLTSPELQEGVVASFYEEMLHFLASMSYNVAFPEFAVPLLAFLRKYKKASRIPVLSQRLSALIEKVIQNVDWVNQKRAAATFVPRQLKEVNEFLKKEREHHKSPLDEAWRRFSTQKQSFEALQHKTELKNIKAEERRRQREQEGDFSDYEGDDVDSDADNEDIIDESFDDDEEGDEDEDEEDYAEVKKKLKKAVVKKEKKDSSRSKGSSSKSVSVMDDDDDVEEYSDPEAGDDD